MTGRIDTYMLEKKVSREAVAKLKTAFKNAIKATVDVSNDGETQKATVTSKFRDQRLDRLTLIAPHWVYKQNYGFEGSKKNGITMRLKATDVINTALQNSSVLEELADKISDIRGEQVMAEINLGNNGR